VQHVRGDFSSYLLNSVNRILLYKIKFELSVPLSIILQVLTQIQIKLGYSDGTMHNINGGNKVYKI